MNPMAAVETALTSICELIEDGIMKLVSLQPLWSLAAEILVAAIEDRR